MSLESEYSQLLERLPFEKTEIEKGLLCKQFAELHGLVFLGFAVANGRPQFHSPDHSPDQSADSPLSELTVKELKALCDAAGIEYGARISKSELVELLSK